MRQLSGCLLVSLIMLPLSLGCGGGKMGDVRGKLLYKGKPVTTGSVYFTPKVADNQSEAGKPAVGVPDERGEFRLSTFAKGDGALVGTHTVVYSAPIVPETDNKAVLAERQKAVAQFGRCKLPPGHTVEVKPGTNEITLNLIE